MAGNDQSRVRVLSRGIGSERIVAGHVRMYDLNLVSAHEPRKVLSALGVERVSQWKCGDLVACYAVQFLYQW